MSDEGDTVMEKRIENGQEVIVYDSLDEWISHLQKNLGDSKDPRAKQFVHDCAYIAAQLQYVQDVGPAGVWHNAALHEILNGEAPQLLNAIMGDPIEMLANPQRIVEKFQAALEMWFIVGYMAGEGPEHIHKCTDTHGVDIDNFEA